MVLWRKPCHIKGWRLCILAFKFSIKNFQTHHMFSTIYFTWETKTPSNQQCPVYGGLERNKMDPDTTRKESERFDWIFFLFIIFLNFGKCNCWMQHLNIKHCSWIMVFSVVWDVFSQLALRWSEGQVESRSPCLSIPQHVTLNSHEVLEHFKTKTPCYPAGTDGLPTPNLSEKTKEDSNRKGKTEEQCTSPNHPPPPLPRHHHRHPLHPSGAVMGACSKCASSFRLASGFVDAA